MKFRNMCVTEVCVIGIYVKLKYNTFAIAGQFL